METLKQFILRLATKAGIAQDDAKLTEFFGSADFEKFNVPDEIVTGIDNNLLSLTQAQDNHPTLKKHYHAQVLNGVDAKIAELIKESGLPADKIAELETEKSTYSRLSLLASAIRDAAKTSSKNTSNEDKTALQKQVDELLLTIKTKETESAAAIANLTAERQKDRVGYEVRTILAGIRTIFDELPPQAKTAALDTLIGKALSEKEAGFAFDDSGSLILKGKDDTAVIGAGNVRLTPKALIDEVLAQNKVLKVTDNTGTKNDSHAGNGSANRVTGQGEALTGNSQSIADMNRAAREAFEKNVA